MDSLLRELLLDDVEEVPLHLAKLWLLVLAAWEGWSRLPRVGPSNGELAGLFLCSGWLRQDHPRSSPEALTWRLMHLSPSHLQLLLSLYLQLLVLMKVQSLV